MVQTQMRSAAPGGDVLDIFLPSAGREERPRFLSHLAASRALSPIGVKRRGGNISEGGETNNGQAFNGLVEERRKEKGTRKKKKKKKKRENKVHFLPLAI
ncbi:hypothetical protein TRV_07637 [Trichophyton verrucosum HKI 0517]|uniref:Uncharacterized protein n=1 Tax=Trichophyton verrucosum (strain HKI 0517) TaxID=663202 RepID=D4DKB5_TRIVH|nr:uncharacterized protein TRV_07637 [Trichophyton verrucosum HKI 0517]EFE37702.1 hypothetical protein TRV_07637 [Trichophyton verrucosum HKI 0517]